MTSLSRHELKPIARPASLSCSSIGPVEGVLHDDPTYECQSDYFACVVGVYRCVRVCKRSLVAAAGTLCERPALRERVGRIAVGLPYCRIGRCADLSGSDHRMAWNRDLDTWDVCGVDGRLSDS